MEQGDRHTVRAPALPPSLDALAAVFSGEAGDPQVGDIWRARWRRVVQVVVLLRVEEQHVEAVPLAADNAMGDAQTVLLDDDDVLFGFTSAWAGLVRRLPMRVLDVRLGAVSEPGLAAIRVGAGHGARITNDLDERSQLRDALASRLDELAAATWLPATAGTVDLQAVMRKRGLTPSQVATDLGVEPGEVIELIRGDRAPSDAIADHLSTLLEVDADAIRNPTVSEEYVRALDLPRFRRRLVERGRASGVDDEAAWRYHVATNELPVAARTTGHSDAFRRAVGLVEDYLR